MMLQLLLVFGAAAALCGARPPSMKFAGVNTVAEGFEGPYPYGSPQMEQALQAAATAASVRWIQLSFPYYYSSINSTGVPQPIPGGVPSGVPFKNASSPTVPAVVATIRQAHSAGLKVSLRPMVDLNWTDTHTNPGSLYRGDIGAHFNSSEWETWFDNYNTYLQGWVAVANAEGVEAFCVGAELTATESQPAHWTTLIAAVRAAYTVPGGLVYYSATGPSSSFPWAASDVIGIDVYPDLGVKGDPTRATLKQLVQGWKPTLDTLAAFSAAHGGKGILFAESGICSANISDVFTQPSYWACYGQPVSQEVQALYYASLFEAAWPQPWMAGVFFWKWAWQGGAGDPTFFPLNKTAQGVMAQYFGAGDGTSTRY